jgi:hypothetical protein
VGGSASGIDFSGVTAEGAVIFWRGGLVAAGWAQTHASAQQEHLHAFVLNG